MSNDESVVSVEVLRQVMKQALGNLRTRVGERLALESDFFWSVRHSTLRQVQPDRTLDRLGADDHPLEA